MLASFHTLKIIHLFLLSSTSLLLLMATNHSCPPPSNSLDLFHRYHRLQRPLRRLSCVYVYEFISIEYSPLLAPLGSAL